MSTIPPSRRDCPRNTRLRAGTWAAPETATRVAGKGEPAGTRSDESGETAVGLRPTVPRHSRWLPEARTRIQRFTPQHSPSRSREHHAHPLPPLPDVHRTHGCRGHGRLPRYNHTCALFHVKQWTSIPRASGGTTESADSAHSPRVSSRELGFLFGTRHSLAGRPSGAGSR